MNKRRLLKLAELLESDAKKRKGIKFDLTEWGTINDPKAPISCGTTACAMGLAALSGAFAGEGLKYSLSHHGTLYISLGGKAGYADGGFSSAATLFEISGPEADWLFDYPSYAGAFGVMPKVTGAAGERMVAKRIRDFVAGKAAP